MRGQKLDPKMVEEIIAEYSASGNMSATARKLNIPLSTVRYYVQGRTNVARDVPEDVENTRSKCRTEFVNQAWDNILKANQLVGRKLDALLGVSSLDGKRLSNIITRLAAGEDMTIEEVKAVQKAVLGLSGFDLRELTTAIGTLYDKTALIDGDPTERHEITAADKALMAGVERIYAKLERNREGCEGGDNDEED